MQDSNRFKVNGRDIAHETIDGETVIVNLKSGCYYSSDQVGVVIWNLIVKGITFGEIIDVLTRRYNLGREEITQSTKDMIAELQEEELIVQDESGVSNEVEKELLTEDDKIEFVPPVLHKYEDMQDLLLLDPIHEVDETGWPNRNRENISDI